MKALERIFNRLNDAFWALLPSCEETIFLVSRNLDEPLPWKQRLSIRIHYTLCIYTRRYVQQLQGMQRFLRSFAREDYQLFEHQELPPARKEALAAKLRNEISK